MLLKVPNVDAIFHAAEDDGLGMYGDILANDGVIGTRDVFQNSWVRALSWSPFSTKSVIVC